MRYFEQLRKSLWSHRIRPFSGRCGKQPEYKIKGRHTYLCYEHYLETDLSFCDVLLLADGETMGCDYEV